MRGKSKFERKQAVLEVDEFVVEAATVLPHDQYNRFANNLLYDYDFIIDAIDTVSAKLHIICRAKQADIPVISCMGTGNRLDPTKFSITDIFKTEGCPLARVMRTELRKRGVKSLPVVFSQEQAKRHSSVPKDDRTIGSISFVPSCAGLIAAGYVIRQLAQDVE
jgi:tRNA A37 threonylcarbamoyladenosine dehydratase